jgi:acyl-CoA synthetase (AMP-forming)/AMP-acid ligase II
MPTFKAADFLALAARESMTHTLMVPAMYNLCIRHPDFDGRSLSSWRIGAYGGAPMPVTVIEQLAREVPSLTLMNCYGSTETTSPSTLMPEGHTHAHVDTVGVPLACVDMRVMDDDGREVPVGTDGEIWIKGPMVVSGYWDNPQATRDSFTAGFWHSGDIGSIDEAGYVRVVDRKKDMINRGGYKIYSAEVENVLYSHPAVRECAVVSKPCPVLGERVHAFIYSDTLETSEEELAAFCRPRLTDYKVPETWTLVAESLPRNANGKLMKRQLRDGLMATLQALEPVRSSR